MSVYLDPLRAWGWKLRGREVLSSHLWSDDEDELLDFAEKIGMPASWAQRSASGILHFDVVESVRLRAVRAGAIELDLSATVKMWRGMKKRRRAA